MRAWIWIFTAPLATTSKRSWLIGENIFALRQLHRQHWPCSEERAFFGQEHNAEWRERSRRRAPAAAIAARPPPIHPPQERPLPPPPANAPPASPFCCHLPPPPPTLLP